MKVSNKLYDVLKWLCLICLPACSIFYVSIANIFGLPYAEAVAGTIAAVCTLIGALIGISTANYNKGGDGDGNN